MPRVRRVWAARIRRDACTPQGASLRAALVLQYIVLHIRRMPGRGLLKHEDRGTAMNDSTKRADYQESKIEDEPILGTVLTLPDGSTTGGRIRQLAPAMDSTTRLALAYVDLQPGSRALPGMYLTGTLQSARRPALTVPAESVVIRDGRSYVLRLEGERCRLTAVTVGRRQGSEAEITAGLKAGDPVVVKGAGFLNDNDLVRIADGRTPG